MDWFSSGRHSPWKQAGFVTTPHWSHCVRHVKQHLLLLLLVRGRTVSPRCSVLLQCRAFVCVFQRMAACTHVRAQTCSSHWVMCVIQRVWARHRNISKDRFRTNDGIVVRYVMVHTSQGSVCTSICGSWFGTYLCFGVTVQYVPCLLGSWFSTCLGFWFTVWYVPLFWGCCLVRPFVWGSRFGTYLDLRVKVQYVRRFWGHSLECISICGSHCGASSVQSETQKTKSLLCKILFVHLITAFESWSLLNWLKIKSIKL